MNPICNADKHQMREDALPCLGECRPERHELVAAEGPGLVAVQLLKDVQQLLPGPPRHLYPTLRKYVLPGRPTTRRWANHQANALPEFSLYPFSFARDYNRQDHLLHCLILTLNHSCSMSSLRTCVEGGQLAI
eukprot:scaffold42737_cov29-Prasinocladus_malaysianus.AAC.1